MQQTSFHAFYLARMLETLPDSEKLLPVFGSSDIKAYPFQISAASFALRSPYQKGMILCDEAGLGKSHEAMLIMAQRWLEGRTKILLCIPNADLLHQWTDLIDRHYSIPYVTITNSQAWDACISEDNPNGFDQTGIVITTYDFAASHEEDAAKILWDVVTFEEANALSGVYQEDSKQARALYRIAGNAFKLLLTGTPIEKNIMDLYGLIWFIDSSVLPGEREFLARYLRKPENYPELAARISRYCFRTLRSQAKAYAKIPERILFTYEYKTSEKERQLYELLYAYINQPEKLAFPKMETYDLALRLLSLQSSSTAAIRQTLTGVIHRLEKTDNARGEIETLQSILAACEKIKTDAKADALLKVLEKGFALLKKAGAAKKAIVFTESVETQKMLLAHIGKRYKAVQYNGASDASELQKFRDTAEVLVSTDSGARGFHLADASFVVHYDLPYNTLKMEQRIDRCHRIGQENAVLSVAFINRENFADVRKLELVSKRTLVSDGVFGISDDVIGGFSDDLPGAFAVISERYRSQAQIEADFRKLLADRTEENKQLVSSAEDLLFTTFTKELAEKVRLTPQYIEERSAEINQVLWELVKWFFTRYNQEHTDCYFEIDDTARTVTASRYEKLPTLFYYWDGSRNKKYQSQKAYGMAADFLPRYGRITLTGILARGILHELECAETGTLTVRGETEPCTLGLYHVSLLSGKICVAEHTVLVGQTESGKTLSEAECEALLSFPVCDVTEASHCAPHWLKGAGRPHPLDRLVPTEDLIAAQRQKLTPLCAEEVEQIKLQYAGKKAALSKEIDSVEAQIKALEAEKNAISNDRLQRLQLDKQITQLRRESLSRQENRFIDEMRLELELEQKIAEITATENLTAQVIREFVVNVEVAR